eukprot:CAMPEP_0204524452 /NCGR_PEP_ID=MMETSP0661-20131031/7384_1 /ASSEMBLY_ACC=CAM_ASM_000606 /TAXON_ID=109239 /ORGANISM="Alexandrium margalefi, Strain AMGDE01CS-322" /LENGTH=522 /DNA_ID=CAMNT_0051530209 /DNA_START=118 /DNA_END=1686 /DNA_ORIENTATION=+
MELTWSWLNLCWSFSFIALGGLLFGYIIGINSNVISPGQLRCPEGYLGATGTWGSFGYGQCYTLTSTAQGVLSSLNLIGACASSLVCLGYADSMGRKLEMQIAALLYLAGAVIAALVPSLWGVYLGFLIYGFGVGFAMHAAPVYIAEISPAEVRGALVSAKEAVIVLGIFLGFLSGYIFSMQGPSGWRFMVLCSGALALVMLGGVSGVPQSPRFLVLQAFRRSRCEGGEAGTDEVDAEALDEALAALQFFRNAPVEEVQKELDNLVRDLKSSFAEEDREEQPLLRPTAKKSALSGVLSALRHRRAMVVGCGLVLLQQVTGQPSVLYFATKIFQSAGFGHSAAKQSVGVGLVKLVATLFTVWKVDKYGRRILLFIGISLMAVALALLTGSFFHSYCKTPHVKITSCAVSNIYLPQRWAVTAVVALMLYVTGYQVGFGPITWVMISEIFPLKDRGSALSVAALVNFTSNIVITLVTPILMDKLMPAGLFTIFLALAVVSLLFVYVFVPETRGKSLEEIETLLKG